MILPGVSGDDIARLFADRGQAVYGFIAYRVADPSTAEELLGDTFERALRNRRHFDPEKGSVTTWLYAIALNCVRDHARRADVERRALERSEAGAAAWVDDAATRTGDRDELLRGLEQLDGGEREILALRFGADLRLREIAGVTGLPPSTVQARLYAGLRKLRAALEPARVTAG